MYGESVDKGTQVNSETTESFLQVWQNLRPAQTLHRDINKYSNFWRLLGAQKCFSWCSSTSIGSANISSMDYTLGLDSCDQQQGKRISWLMDSGASQSVTNSLSDFWDYQLYSTPVSFGTAGKTIIQAIGSGTVKGFVTVEGGKRVWITLTNVAYIPNASGRLFSTGVVENHQEKPDLLNWSF